jgi:hypothetical protein
LPIFIKWSEAIDADAKRLEDLPEPPARGLDRHVVRLDNALARLGHGFMPALLLSGGLVLTWVVFVVVAIVTPDSPPTDEVERDRPTVRYYDDTSDVLDDGWDAPDEWTDLDCSDVGGPVFVFGADENGLDADNDGVGCE